MFVVQLEREMAGAASDCLLRSLGISSVAWTVSGRSLCDKVIQRFEVLAEFRDLGRGVNAPTRGDLMQIAQI